jgi:hypothetical protein
MRQSQKYKIALVYLFDIRFGKALVRVQIEMGVDIRDFLSGTCPCSYVTSVEKRVSGQ